MSKVLQFPAPELPLKAATCGCGGQTFTLVCNGNTEEPDFVYCESCQRRMSKVMWVWTDGHPPSAV
jgi:hypothetical protein